MTSLTRFTVPVCFALLLSACQQDSTHERSPVVNPAQIAAVVAASEWVNRHCDRSDIPDQETLIRNALTQGKVGNGQVDRKTLMQAIDERYDAIDNDEQTRSEKCAALNASLAPFLQKIK